MSIFMLNPRGPVAQQGRRIVPVVQGQAPDVVQTFPDFIQATGGRPLLRVGEQKLLQGGPFWIDVTITDNAAVAADLTLGSVWDKYVQGHYSSAASRLKAVLRLAGIGLYINDDLFRAETQALKESLDNEAYIRISRGPNTVDLPLRARMWEPWSAFEFKQAAAADAERALLGGRPWIFGKEYQFDLEVDTFQFRVDNAINWAGGNISAKVAAFGWLAPRDYPGTGIKDTDVCSMGSDAYQIASVGPRTHAALVAAGVGGPQTIGAWSVGGLRI